MPLLINSRNVGIACVRVRAGHPVWASGACIPFITALLAVAALFRARVLPYPLEKTNVELVGYPTPCFLFTNQSQIHVPPSFAEIIEQDGFRLDRHAWAFAP